MNQLKNIRQELNLSQKEFAKELGFDRSYISLLENEKRNISKYVIKKIKEKIPYIDTNIFFK